MFTPETRKLTTEQATQILQHSLKSEGFTNQEAAEIVEEWLARYSKQALEEYDQFLGHLPPWNTVNVSEAGSTGTEEEQQ